MEKENITNKRNIGFTSEDLIKIDHIRNHYGLTHRVEAIRLALTSKANELKEVA